MATAETNETDNKRYEAPWLSSSRSDWRFLRRRCQTTPTQPIGFSFFCEFLVFFCSHLFVRAPFAQTPRRGSTEEGRPDTAVVELWAQSVQCVARGVRSKSFFQREWIRRLPGGFLHEAFFIYLLVSSVFSDVGVFAHTNLVENGTTCHDSGFPVPARYIII